MVHRMIVNIILGAISSVFGLWLAVYYFSPKIRISSKIMYMPEERSNLDYYFKYHNNGWRTAIDLKIRIIVVVHELRVPISRNTFLFRLKTSQTGSFRSKAMGSTVVRFSGKVDNPSANIVKIQNKETIEILTSGDLSKILKLGSDCYVTIELVASDGKTGIRSYFQSSKLRASDILDSKEYGFYFDDADVYVASKYKGIPPARKYPRMHTNVFNSNIFVIKLIRLFYDLTFSSYQRFKTQN